MKKLFAGVFLTAVVIGLSALVAFGAGSVTMTMDRYSEDVDVLTVTWTADASDGSVPATNTTGYYPNPRRQQVGYVSLVTTNPGSTAPTDNYDIALFDLDDVDIMGNALDNRDTSTSEQAVPKIGAISGGRIMPGILNVVISNNAVNSATGIIRIILAY